MHIIADWLFDPHSRYLSSGPAKHRLSPKAAKVLLVLVREPGRVWTRDALLDAVWSEQAVGEEVLTQAIAELRRALGDDFRRPRFIETVHKTGYRLLLKPDEDAAAGPFPGGWATDTGSPGWIWLSNVMACHPLAGPQGRCRGARPAGRHAVQLEFRHWYGL